MGKGLQLWPVGHQRGKGVGQRDGRADGDVVAVMLDPPEFFHPCHVQHLAELHVHLGHPESDVGATGDELGLGVGGAGGQQFSQGARRVISQIGLQPLPGLRKQLQF